MLLLPGRRWHVKPPPGTLVLDWTQPLTRGLVVGLVLNEGAGTLVQNLARPLNPGSISDPSWGVHPVGGPAFSFSGTTNRQIVIPHEAALNVGMDLTIVTRATVTSTTGDQNLCAKGNGAFEFDVSGTSLRFNKDEQAVLVSATIAASSNVRQFAAASKNSFGSPSVEMFVDGALVASGAPGGNLLDTSTALYVGSDQGVTTKVLSGQMLDFWLWNRMLSATEIGLLVRQPYAMLRPLPQRVYFDIGFAAGGAVFRARKNLPINQAVNRGATY